MKWKHGDYREMPVKIQQDAVQDFCEMMGWDEKDFSNNTVRRPIVCEDPEDPINSEQKIKPIFIDPKIKEMSEKPRLPKDWKKIMSGKSKRKRRTKAEMDVVRKGEHVKEQGVRKPRTNLLFSEEVDKIIKANWEDNRDVDLIEIIKEKLDQTFTKDQIKAHRKQLGFVKSRGGQSTREKKKVDPIKKIGPTKKWTDEVFQFLKDNINNFSNKELCEELESQFNLKTNSTNLQQQMSAHGIKRDHESNLDKEIENYILKSKVKSEYNLRDRIIEKFEKNVSLNELRRVMKERDVDLPGEKPEDEVKRIREQREEPIQEFFEDDEDVDEMDLDN